MLRELREGELDGRSARVAAGELIGCQERVGGR